MKRISITEKLIFYFVCIGIIAIVTIGAYSYYFAKKALLDRTFDQLISLRLEKKKRVEQFFLERIRDAYFMSQSDEIRKSIQDLTIKSEAKSNSEGIKNNSSINYLLNSSDCYNRLFIIDTNDSVLNVKINFTETPVRNQNDKETYKNLLNFCKKIGETQKPVIQDFSSSNKIIYVGAPVFNVSKNIMGYVILELNISSLNKIMFDYSENNGLGKTGETYLVGDDSLMRSNSRFMGDAVLNIKVNSTSVKNAFSGKTGVDIVHDYRNISCLSSFSKLNVEGLNWVIIAEIDEKEAMTPIYSIRNNILLISVLIAAGIFVLAFFFSLRITTPLKKLQKASEQIGEGNYDVELKIPSKDEIGLLTEKFNNMVVRLKKQSEEIEAGKIKRISSLLDGQEMERQRLARDLHDSLGQLVLTANIKLEQAKNAEQIKKQQIIAETQELLKYIIQEIRNISNDLMPTILAAFGLDQGVENLCKEVSNNIGIEIKYSGENIVPAIDTKFQIYLFRIIQEALNNVVKHSEATLVNVFLSFNQNALLLNIKDNGKGFDTNNADVNGNGLLNIKERVKSLKGICKINSEIGKGTQIEIIIPVIK